MENKNKEKNPVRMRALKSGSYSLVLCAAALVLVILLNLVVSSLPSTMTKLDASAVGMLTVGDETKELLSGVDEPVTLYLIAPRGGEDMTILGLMERYADLNKNIKIESVDPDVRPGFTSQYTDDALSQNSVIVVGEKRSYPIDYTEIYVTSYENITEEDLYNYYTYGIAPQGTPYFYGELALSSAIDFVTAEQIPMLYTLTGHSEDALSDTIRSYLTTDNIIPAELGLLGDTAIPEDCAAILLNNPKTDLSVYETELLTAYLKKGGNVILVTDFRYCTAQLMPNLLTLTEMMGMTAEDGVVVETNRSNYNGQPTYLLPVLSTQGPAAEMNASSYTFIVNAHGIALTGEGSAAAASLLKTTTASFIKKAGANLETFEKEDGDVDGPCSVAASATLTAENGESKFVWFASPAILSDQWDYYVNGGNSALFTESVNWMCEKPVSLSILAKTMQVQALVVPESAVGVWSLTTVILLPLAILGGGFAIWLRRRRR